MPQSIYNTITRKKEIFKPMNPPYVGLYVCGPTVYSDPHLGHARSAIIFDLVYRYLSYTGYKVRYVRNITDVGHLENDSDQGEDKIAKKARLEKLEPMEVVQRYTDVYHRTMDMLNNKRPDIEPRASGHIIEQIEMTKKILNQGYAYEVNGSVYFDVIKYSASNNYGNLSGRVLDELVTSTRTLEARNEKRNTADFALWKKAQTGHIMRWPSPWGEGFPGWHIECSVMSAKYLGHPFDIHGGGMDLLFPHHECEIAQSKAATGKDPVKYWMHNNMITIDGQKMSKSLGNFITLDELFAGNHKALEMPYSPMTVRFFILQAHYRGTLDFSNVALQAAEKGFKRLMNALETLDKLKPSAQSTSDIKELEQKCYAALDDDFNSPVLLSNLFDGARIINSVFAGKETISTQDIQALKKLFEVFVFGILGLKKEESAEAGSELSEKLIQALLEIRNQARENKDFATSDKIRDTLADLKIAIKDEKGSTAWSYES